MKRTSLLIFALKDNNNLTDKEISEILNVEIQKVQEIIHQITINKTKWKEFSIIRHGKYGNYSRELITKEANENDLIDSADWDAKKGLRAFDKRNKKIKISISTREGQENRMKLLQRVLQSNLSISIEAQKLLQ